MKLNEIFATEHEDILLESYRDFKKEWDEILTLSPNFNKATLLRRYPDIARVFKIKTFGEISNVVEGILKNNQTKALLRQYINLRFYDDENDKYYASDTGDIMTWVKSMRSFADRAEDNSGLYNVPVMSVLSAIDQLAEILIRKEEKSPRYDKVASTSSYTIFKVHNFEGAKKLRNMVRSTWCIGVHESHFHEYGEDAGRDTYIVFLNKTKKGMVIHVDPRNSNNNLVTAHCNDSEAKIGSSGRMNYTRGDGVVSKDLNEAMPREDQEKLFKSVGIRFNPAAMDRSMPMEELKLFWKNLRPNFESIKLNKSQIVRQHSRYVIDYREDNVESATVELIELIELVVPKTLIRMDEEEYKVRLDVLLDIFDHIERLSKIGVYSNYVRSYMTSAKYTVSSAAMGEHKKVRDVVETLVMNMGLRR